MKRLWTLWNAVVICCMLCCVAPIAQAQQSVLGSEISYRSVGGGNYEVYLDVYSDCKQGALNSTENLRPNVCGTNQSFIPAFLEPNYPREVSPICVDSIFQTSCNTGTRLGVYHYRYKALFNNITNCNGIIRFDWRYTFRQNNITSIDNPNNTPHFNLARMEGVVTNGANTSPNFSYDPFFVICEGQNIHYNVGAIDPDGDELRYKLVHALSGIGTNVSYNAGYSPLQPLPSSPAITLDPNTGDLTIHPLGNSETVIFVIQVEEYRNGIQIGQTRRDFQVRVRNCRNDLPDLGGFNNTNGFTINAVEGTTLVFDLFARDTFNALGLPVFLEMEYDSSIAGMQDNIFPVPPINGGQRLQGQFTWTPSATDVGLNYFTVRTIDNNCPRVGWQIRTYTINVQAAAPAFTATVIPTSTCAGGANGTATATPSGGSGPYSYQWSLSANSQTTAVATNLPAGQHSVTITDATSSSIIELVQILSNPPTPGPIIDTDTIICTGDSLKLIDISGQTGIHFWRGPLGFFSNAPDPVIPNAGPANTGLYRVYLETGPGCRSLEDTVFVSVAPPLPPPALTGPLTVCYGDLLTLTASHSNPIGDSIYFIGPNVTRGQVIGAPNQLLFVLEGDANYETGTWQVEVVDPVSGCFAVSNPIFVTILDDTLVVQPDTTICRGEDVTLSAGFVSGAVYFWGGNPTPVGPFVTLNNVQRDTVVFVEMITPSSCVFLDSIRVRVDPRPPTPDLQSFAGNPLCEGIDPLYFTSATTTFIEEYIWTLPDNSVFSTNTPVFPPTFPTSVLSDSGLYTLAVVDSNGCISRDTSLLLMVNPTPAIPIITAPTTICDGDTLIIEFSGGCDEYQWFTATNNGTTTDSFLVILPTDSDYPSLFTNLNIQVACNNLVTGCQSPISAPFTVTLGAQPQALNPTNTGPVCINEAVSLSVDPQPNAQFFWSTDPAFGNLIGQGTNIIVDSIFSDTTFYVEVITGDGCRAVDSTFVPVFPAVPPPVVSAVDSTVCENDLIELIATTTAPFVEWIGPNGFISTGFMPILTATPAQTGWYFAAAESSSGCFSAFDSVFIQVVPTPVTPVISGANNICEGNDIVLTVTGTCDTLFWLSNLGDTFTTTNTLIIPPTSILYGTNDWEVVCVTAQGCEASSNLFYLQVNPSLGTPIVYNEGPACNGDTLYFITPSILGVSNNWYADPAATQFINSGDTLVMAGFVGDTIVYLEQSLNGCPAPVVADTGSILAPVPVPIVSPDDAACIGDTIIIATFTPADDYFWTAPDGQTYTSPDIVINGVDLADDGSFFLELIDTNGCEAPVIDVKLIVNPLPPTPIVFSNDLNCNGDTLMFDASRPFNTAVVWITPDNDTLLGPQHDILSDSAAYLDGIWTVLFTDTLTGCQIHLDTFIEIDSVPPFLGVQVSDPVCVGDSVTLTAVPVPNIGRYEWYNVTNFALLDTTQQITIANIISDTVFGFVVRKPNGCGYFMDSILVTVVPASPAPFIFGDTTVCPGQLTTFSTDSADAYLWQGPNTLTTQQSITIGPVGVQDTGIYTLTVFDTAGCASPSTSIRLSLSPVASPPVVDPIGIVCFGNPVQPTATITSPNCDSSYWIFTNATFPNGLIYPDTLGFSVTPGDPAYANGTWQLICQNALGCTVASNTEVAQIRQVLVPPVSNNGPVCFGDDALLSAGVAPNLIYKWYTDNTLNNQIGGQGATLLVLNLTTDSTFYLVVEDTFGCTSPTNATTVNILPPPPPPTINPLDTVVCEGETIRLNAPLAVSYTWLGPNGFTATQRNVIINNATQAQHQGWYFLAVSNNQGCFSELDSVFIRVNIPPPAPSITPLIYICESDTLFLNAGLHACSDLTWSVPNGNTITGDSLVILPSDINHEGGLWQVSCNDNLTGCSSNSNLSLVIIATEPATQATSSNDPVCVGNPVTLTTPNPGAGIVATWYADTTFSNLVGVGDTVIVPQVDSNTTFYLVLTNSGGCNSAFIPTPVTVYTAQLAPSLADSIEVCEGDSLQLSTSTNAPSYQWTAANGFTGTGQTVVVNVAATLVDSGQYGLVTIDANGCASPPATTQVLVRALPAPPSITSNGPICDGDSLILSTNSTCNSMLWVGPVDTLLGGAGFNRIGIDPLDANYTPVGTWTLICTDTVIGCASVSNTITTVVNLAPVIDSLSATTPLCAGNDLELIGNAIVAAGATPIYAWYDDPALGQSIATGDSIVLNNWNSSTRIYLEVTDNLTSCTALDSIDVLVVAPIVQPIIDSVGPLCVGDTLSLSTPTVASQYDWQGANGYVATGVNPPPIVVRSFDAGVYTLTIFDSIGCAASTSINIVVNPVPQVNWVSNTSPACVGDSVILSAEPLLGATYDWYHVPSGNLVGSGQSYQLSAVSLVDTGAYYAIVSLNGCSTQTGNTIVTIYNPAAANSNAGVDQQLCGADSVLLSADPLATGLSGQWTSNGTALIFNPTNETTWATNLSVGTTTFYWSLSSSACANFSSDSVLVQLDIPSTEQANAGGDQSICASTTINLNAISPTVGTAVWSQSTAQAALGVTIVDPNNPSTGLTGLQAGNSYQFVWTLSNGACGDYSSDTVIVALTAAPNQIVDAGPDRVICAEDTIQLAALAPFIGSGRWQTSSSAVIVNPNQANATVSNLVGNTLVFVWSLSEGACVDYAQDTMLVTRAGASPIALPDIYTLLSSNVPSTIDVVSNDQLTNNWDIYITVPTNEGQLTNLNDGRFEILLQGVSNNQSFIYELCNPACPSDCDTALVTILVETAIECEFPNIFTPNGDGVNDVFLIPCLDGNQAANLLVFNRWGDLVYETDRYQNQWDGTHEGQPLPDGTYFYIFRINEQETQGSVEIRH